MYCPNDVCIMNNTQAVIRLWVSGCAAPETAGTLALRLRQPGAHVYCRNAYLIDPGVSLRQFERELVRLLAKLGVQSGARVPSAQTVLE